MPRREELGSTSTEKRRTIRTLNERIRLVSEPFARLEEPEEPTGFVCECADEACFRSVSLTVAEWRAATAAPGYSVVRPDHVAPGEQAVVATGRYAVVRPARAGEPTHRGAGRRIGFRAPPPAE